MTSSLLNDVVATYRSTLDALPTQPADDALQQVARALLARDAVADVLSKQSSALHPILLTELTELDQQLKASAATLTDIVGRETIANWREAAQPPANSWWWAFDERATTTPSPLWTILSVLFLAASAALTAEITRRFLSSGGADLAAIFIPLLQAILTFLSGSALTQTGQEWIEGFLSRRNMRRKYYPLLKAAIPLIILLVISMFYFSLPYFARYYVRGYLDQQGVKWHATGKLNEAMKKYERAISLDPDYAPSHYSLGSAYEALGDYDKAITEYQTALRLNKDFYFAHTNLARLLMLRRNDPATALQLLNITLLNTTLDLKPEPEKSFVKYLIYKTRAWVHFNLKDYHLAAADVCEALTLRQEGAAAYCLLAQILEAKDKLPEAKAWKLCEAYSKGAAAAWRQCEAYKSGQEDEIEASWLSLAQERLRKEATK
jgi:tetratricopeptide (TPR) repeat protein